MKKAEIVRLLVIRKRRHRHLVSHRRVIRNGPELELASRTPRHRGTRLLCLAILRNRAQRRATRRRVQRPLLRPVRGRIFLPVLSPLGPAEARDGNERRRSLGREVAGSQCRVRGENPGAVTVAFEFALCHLAAT
jgi:hypothetical protein